MNRSSDHTDQQFILGFQFILGLTVCLCLFSGCDSTRSFRTAKWPFAGKKSVSETTEKEEVAKLDLFSNPNAEAKSEKKEKASETKVITKKTEKKPDSKVELASAKKVEPVKTTPQKTETTKTETATVKHDQETLRLIEEELKHADPDEREQILKNWKQLDPILIRELVQVRRRVREYMKAEGTPSKNPDVIIQAGHTAPVSNQAAVLTALGGGQSKASVTPDPQSDSPANTSGNLNQPVSITPNGGNQAQFQTNAGIGTDPWENNPLENSQQQKLSLTQQLPPLTPDQPLSFSAGTQPAIQQQSANGNPNAMGTIGGHLSEYQPQVPDQTQQVQTVHRHPTAFPPVFNSPQEIPHGLAPATQQKQQYTQFASDQRTPNAGLNGNRISPAGFERTTSLENNQTSYQPLPEMPDLSPTPPNGMNELAPVPNTAVSVPVKNTPIPGNTQPVSQTTADPSWTTDLQKLITLTEAEIANLKIGQSPEERHQYLQRHVNLRILYLMSGRAEDAIKPIPNLDAAHQEFWQQMLWSMANYFDTEAIPLEDDRTTEVVRQLKIALEKLQPVAKLQLKNVSFCHNIINFGNYEQFPRDEFTRGQPVLLYAEVGNFTSQRTADGKLYETRLRSTVEILTPGPEGKLVSRKPFAATRDFSRNFRQDYFYSYDYMIPKNIGLGPHVLKLTVVDDLGQKIATETINFTVK